MTTVPPADSGALDAGAFDAGSPDAGADDAVDAGAPADLVDAAGPDVAADVPVVACTTDRDCPGVGLVCQLDVGRCVECNAPTDCADGTLCFAHACRRLTPCTSSRMCPNQVCSPVIGYCVDCNNDRDCPATQQCRSSACVERPPPCRSSRDCSAMGMVCDLAQGLCVECVGDVDCNLSYSDGCEVNTATSQTSCGVCGNACGSGQVCRAGVCVVGCPGTGTLCSGVCRELTTDGANCGVCGRVCPTGQVCAAGVCGVGPAEADVRLNSGILELYHAGEWRSVCDDRLEGVAAVACRQLGFRTGTAAGSQTCASSGFWLDNVVCAGTEANLVACTHQPIGSHDCGSTECIRLTCTN